MIIDHIGMNVSDYAGNREFFDKALAPMGIGQRMEVEGACGYGRNTADFWIAVGERHAPMHIAFVAENREQVRQFYRAALAAGARDNGEPGIRPDYGSDYGLNYFTAFAYGPDGHNLEAVCQLPQD